MCTASPNTAVPCAAIACNPGASIGWAKPHGSSVSGDSYPVESTDSSTVILSTRSQMPADTSARRLAKPGFMPEPKSELPPRSHASRRRRRPSPSAWPVMNAAVADTFTPASRMRTSSSTSGHFGAYITQSGRKASSASMSLVAVTPSGAMPHSSPTSAPSLSGDHA